MRRLLKFIWRLQVAGVVAGLPIAGCGSSDAPKPSESAAVSKSESTADEATSPTTQPSEPQRLAVDQPDSPPIHEATPQLQPDSGPASPTVAVSLTQPSKQSVEVVNALLRASSQQAPAAWTRAEQAVLALGSDAIPALAAQLSSTNSFAREISVMMLARLGEDSLVASQVLVKSLNDPSKFVRANAASILTLDERYTASVVPVLRQLLNDSDVELQILATAALGNLGVKAAEVVPQLTKRLSSMDERLRSAAANSLGQIGQPSRESVPELTKLLNDESTAVRTVAHEAITRIGKTSRP